MDSSQTPTTTTGYLVMSPVLSPFTESAFVKRTEDFIIRYVTYIASIIVILIAVLIVFMVYKLYKRFTTKKDKQPEEQKEVAVEEKVVEKSE